MSSMADVLQSLLVNAPDPNEPLPVKNRKATIIGVIVPFLVCSWISVLMRLWTRIKIVRDPGWDDLFIVLGVILDTVGNSAVFMALKYGLGKHFLYLGQTNMENWSKWFWLGTACYITNAVLIKISLLLQYLRVFKTGLMRWTCIGLLGVVVVWGVIFTFMAWFPCFPVRTYWNRDIPGHCYAFGWKNPSGSFVATFEAHTGINMVLDLVIFLTPMALFRDENLKRKSKIAMAGIFAIGAIVVLVSTFRLYAIVSHRAGIYPYLDFSWWAPLPIVLSCLEIDLAIICASMPIFWPVVEAKFSHIFVTHEVHITEHRRLEENGIEYELEHAASVKSGRSMSGNSESEERLTKGRTAGVPFAQPFAHYKDQYVVAHVDPLGTDEIKQKSESRWA